MSALDVSLAMLACAYVAGMRAYRQCYGKPWGVWRGAAFGCALGVIAFALEGLDALADRWFSAHMLQHLLLIYAAAPLALCGAPLILAAATLPPWIVRPALRALHASPLRTPFTLVACWTLLPIVLWSAHFSGLYELALEHPLIHVGEHALFFGAAVLFWIPIIEGSPMTGRLNGAWRAAYLFAAMPQCALLGMALSGSSRVSYPHYAERLGVAVALADQRTGADVMWIVGGAASTFAFVLAAMSWAREERRSMARAMKQAAGPALLCCALVFALPAYAAEHAGPSFVRGASLYEEKCASCHGEALQGSSQAPPLMGEDAAAVDFFVSTGRMPLAAPGVEPVRGDSNFSPSETAALVRYVVMRSGGARELPRVRVGGDIVRGRRLFAENCQACHGVVGQGAAVGYGWTAPSLAWSTPEQIAEAVRIGPGVMPRFDRRTLSNDELDALVGYVRALRTRTDDRGGWSIGHLGPVGEGLVGWIAGLGSLLGLIRWVGTTVSDET